ncbi:hypothetical protein NSK_001369 [Nannochloropsis salina CCMP1776]|uniref:General transcription factor IIH subunit 4 n=1 Tax=Nannochloropsis salina CCMP1776 TaxID=1027361 RepID=A0A4D9DC25_9STRA|nr:hypothetical protein NSK_001369 [Nannochloropsis salina CCMP1776]|eukprot:TFJ87035.1 hypothetical protein NSK_001369 [Nannochloropsis salina CCMP1776]
MLKPTYRPDLHGTEDGSAHVATVFDLLGTLPRISLDRLYGLEDLGSASSSCTPSASPFPWTCRAVFQSLTPLAKQYVMRLLCLPEGVRQSCLKSWVEPRFFTGHQKAVQQLDRLRILLSSEDEDIEEDEDDRDGGHGRLGNGKGRPSPRYRLNGHFRKNLQAALTNQLAGPWGVGRALEEKAAPDAALPPSLPSEELETYMCDKWNGVLHYLVGAEEAGFPDPAEEVKQFLADTGMMAVPEEEEGEEVEGEVEGEGGVVLMEVEGKMGKEGKGRRHLRITNAGINFLLKDVHLQVWRFVAYVIAHEAASRDEILTFLFQLSYCAVGRPYPVRALSPTQQALLEKFISFGLIYQDDRHSRHFYPTAVAVNLIFGGTVQEERLRRGHGHIRAEGRENRKELRLVDPSQLAVIVETNYQLVAYTSSSLHVEMLRIFTDVRCRLPNVVIGFITRASVRRAMASGITAATILSFLKTHTHVAVRTGKGRLLPENVEAQIELWHQERSRVKFEEVMMIDLSSLMVEEFEEVRTYAENLAVVCWASRRRGGGLWRQKKRRKRGAWGKSGVPRGGVVSASSY